VGNDEIVSSSSSVLDGIKARHPADLNAGNFPIVVAEQYAFIAT